MNENFKQELAEHFDKLQALKKSLHGAKDNQAENTAGERLAFLHAATNVVKPVFAIVCDFLEDQRIVAKISRTHPVIDFKATSDYIGLHCLGDGNKNGVGSSESNPFCFIGYGFDNGAITMRSKINQSKTASCSSVPIDDLSSSKKVETQVIQFIKAAFPIQMPNL